MKGACGGCFLLSDDVVLFVALAVMGLMCGRAM